MKLPIIRKIRKEDLGSDVPDAVTRLLSPLNQFIEQVGIAVTGRLSFGDNLAGKYVEQTFVSGVELIVNPLDSRRVVGIIPVYAVNDRITGFGFTQKDDLRIGITIDLNSAGESKCKVLLLFL